MASVLIVRLGQNCLPLMNTLACFTIKILILKSYIDFTGILKCLLQIFSKTRHFDILINTLLIMTLLVTLMNETLHICFI